ncbi:polysaccharide pyruvyl transferase family protein [Pseudonocardia sp. RS010]|uniref:polysaccharide pyruvyl transferase family protein n=1 Tax=Pseudonocardia sp. RS010 TaxID=3385979 RepID=UPI0039A1E14D
MRGRPSRSRGRPPAVGVFGLLGSGNLGNDGSMAAVLAHVRSAHPDARLGALCAGPDRVAERYGVPATRMNWFEGEYRTAAGPRAIALKALGKVVDAFRTAAWVRRHDLVIVPGMGVLEATLPLRPWGFPYSLFLLCATGRLLGTRIALVGVGADEIRRGATRRLIVWSARLAHFRSYRDELSRDALAHMGVDTAEDPVHPDLAFALDLPTAGARYGGGVGVGVMDYSGSNDDRADAQEIRARYLQRITEVVRRLLREGREVRLFTGDEADEVVVAEILAEVATRPDGVDPAKLHAGATSDLETLMGQMGRMDLVVATRYHNVLSALAVATPTISLSYAGKNDALMADMGFAEFCQPVRGFEVDRLFEQIAELEDRQHEVRATLTERTEQAARRVTEVLAQLSPALLPPAGGQAAVSTRLRTLTRRSTVDVGPPPAPPAR